MESLCNNKIVEVAHNKTVCCLHPPKRQIIVLLLIVFLIELYANYDNHDKDDDHDDTNNSDDHACQFTRASLHRNNNTFKNVLAYCEPLSHFCWFEL